MLFDLREVGLVHNYHKNYTQKKKYLTPFFPQKKLKINGHTPQKVHTVMDTRQKVHTVDTRPCLNKQVSLSPH